MLDRNINREGVFGLAGLSHVAKENPAGRQQQERGITLSRISPLTRTAMAAPGAAGELHVYKNFKAADNAIGFTSSTGSFGADTFYLSLVVDSLFVGETDNIGNPVTPEEKGLRPQPFAPKRSIPEISRSAPTSITTIASGRGQHDIREFPGQQTTRIRRAFLAVVYSRAPGLPPKNTVKSDAKYINAKPVYFPKIDSRFDSDNREWFGLPDRGDPRSGRIDDRHPLRIPMFCSTTARTTASLRTTRARSSQPGTPRCARVISDAFSSASGGTEPQGVLVWR